MLRVFNCGIGMALVVADADRAPRRCCAAQGETVFRLGRIAAGGGTASVRFAAMPRFA